MNFLPVRRLAEALSDCAWLDAKRAKAYARILLLIVLAGAVGWIALSPAGLDRQGKPIGTDFVGFYTASQLALAGHPALAYNVGAHWAAQRALFGAKLGYTAFFYPPPALLMYWPLALAPYFVSLAIWLTASGLAFYRVLLGYLPSLDTVTFLAFPAIFINAAHGQNGFLSAALLGGGLLILDRRPVLAGVCFGAMVYKPHLALAIPFALLFARRWTTLGAAAVAATALCLASLFAFGSPTWTAFFTDAPFARATLEHGLVGDEKMQSVFAGVRLLRGPLALAWGAQVLAALSAIAALWLLRACAFQKAAEAPVVVCAGLLASPFVLDYDLTLLAIPLVWLLGEGRRSVFLPYEKTLMALAFMLPLVSRISAGTVGLPLAPLVIAALLLLVLRRALTPVIETERPAPVRDEQIGFSLALER